MERESVSDLLGKCIGFVNEHSKATGAEPAVGVLIAAGNNENSLLCQDPEASVGIQKTKCDPYRVYRDEKFDDHFDGRDAILMKEENGNQIWAENVKLMLHKEVLTRESKFFQVGRMDTIFRCVIVSYKRICPSVRPCVRYVCAQSTQMTHRFARMGLLVSK